MWIIKNGSVPDGQDVCHTCDTPRCVRIDHLFLGPALVNMHDMIAKGRARHPTGIENGVAGFTEAQVSIMLALYGTGLVNKNQLSKHFGTDRTNMGKIVRGLSYKACKPCEVTPEIIALAKEIALRFKRGPNSTSFKIGHV